MQTRTNVKKVDKKICMVSAVPGTLWGFYGGLIKQLKVSSMDVTIASSDMPHLSDFKEQLGCKVFPVEITRKISPLKDLAAICKLTRHFNREKYDIVHAHTPKGGLIGMISAFLAGISNRVYTIHGLLLETSSGLKRKLLWSSEWLTCKLATKVLVDSHSLKERVIEEKLCPVSKMQILGDGTACGINLDKFNITEKTAELGRQTREKLNIPQDAKVIGFLGRIVPDKGIKCLIDAFEMVQKKSDNIYLLLMGTFETVRETVDEETKQRITNNSRVVYGGYANDICSYYSAMDIFVLPSRREGFPYTPLEAGAMGLPVIATKVTGCVDAVVNNVTGLLVDVDNYKQLAEAMLKLLGDPELRKEFGRRGRERVRQLFDSRRLIAEHIALYERILGG
jgi:glycosyltransferase involved in cell wall biosynthesis